MPGLLERHSCGKGIAVSQILTHHFRKQIYENGIQSYTLTLGFTPDQASRVPGSIQHVHSVYTSCLKATYVNYL